jgi:hypothetical protein
VRIGGVGGQRQAEGADGEGAEEAHGGGLRWNGRGEYAIAMAGWPVARGHGDRP